jgi:hypothetical protein
MEAEIQRILDQLMEKTPLKKWLEFEGPLRYEAWARRLAGHPDILTEFKPLVFDETGRPRYGLRPDQEARVAECILRHPALKSIAEKEWRHFHAHNLRIVLFGRDLPAPKVKSAEWKKIYDRLDKLLSATAREDHFGNGDYLLVMDEVGEPGHKIEVQNPEILTPPLIREIQRILKGGLFGWRNVWYVIIQIDVDSLRLDIEPFCMVVWADHVDDIGDRKRLKELLGSRFLL